MNYNSVFGNVGRIEEGKALNMVPMEMRHKDVEDIGLIAFPALQMVNGEIEDT